VDWTKLPGPDAFTAQTVQDLLGTYSVIARNPPYLDDSWSRQVKSSVEGNLVWNEVDCSPDDFYRFCARLCGKEQLSGPRGLLNESLHCQLFYISRPSADDWARWSRLLTDFVIFQNAIDERFQRNVFLVVLHDAKLEAPNEALLKKRDILDFLREEDSFLHACQCRPCEGNSRSLEDQIRIHVCSELALWDFDLCRYLLDVPLQKLLRPADVIKEYLAEQGDAANGAEASSSSASPSDPNTASAVALALNGNEKELGRRVWRGQVQVLFPLLEDQRYKLIKRLESECPSVLRNVTSEDGIVEIGPLYRMMKRNRDCPHKLTNLASRLRGMRNDIAHLKVCELHNIPPKSDLLT
jgi:hypothetical protein